jgi:thioredoxin 1
VEKIKSSLWVTIFIKRWYTMSIPLKTSTDYERKEIIMAVIHLTETNFDKEVLKADIPVLVDFWAPWCNPCRMLSPVIEEIAEEVTDVKVCKINIDEASILSDRYGVMSIPTLILFKNGEIAAKSVGAKQKPEIMDFIRA